MVLDLNERERQHIADELLESAKRDRDYARELDDGADNIGGGLGNHGRIAAKALREHAAESERLAALLAPEVST